MQIPFITALFLIFQTCVSAAVLKWITPCEADEDCNDLENASCIQDICNCGNDNYVCKTKTNYIMVNKIGEECSEGKFPCNAEGSRCLGGVCVCEEGRVQSGDGRRCLKVSGGIGDSCEENTQCYANIPSTICRGNKCACQDDMLEKNGSCYKNAGLGQRCVKNEECSLTEFSSCVNSKCWCDDGRVAAGSRCLLIAQELEAPCSEDVQCTAVLGKGAYCNRDHCQCKDLYQYKKKINKCVQDHLLGEICANHSECHQPGPTSSRLECILGVCKCQYSYIEQDGYCLSAAERNSIIVAILAANALLLAVFV